MSASLTKSKDWSRSRAVRLHTEFVTIERARRLTGIGLTNALTALTIKLDGAPIGGGKTMRASYPTIRRNWDHWLANGQKAEALLPNYKGGNRRMPPELHAEIQRVASTTTGGRDKHGKGWEATRLRKHFEKRWHRGEDIPGLGTWQEWWEANNPGINFPPRPPEFPYCAKTVNRAMGGKAAQTMGNIGFAAAQKHLHSLELDYSKLRRCELYTLDDVRLDLAAIDDLTGSVVNVTAYIMMEVGSRSIVAFLVKPEKAITAADVDELVAAALSTDGYGIGTDYVTHIKFERGTVACSQAAQAILESTSHGRIQIHRTGMDSGVRWVGATTDRATGHAAGKAVIESFNRNLHRYLLALPGQRGNTYANQPANLGIESRGAADASRRKANTTTAAAERIGQFRAGAIANGERPLLSLPLLLVSQVQQCVAAAIRNHNETGGHKMQGFATVTEAEISPGDWREIGSDLNTFPGENNA